MPAFIGNKPGVINEIHRANGRQDLGSKYGVQDLTAVTGQSSCALNAAKRGVKGA